MQNQSIACSLKVFSLQIVEESKVGNVKKVRDSMMREMCQVIKEKLILKLCKNTEQKFEDSKQKALIVTIDAARDVKKKD